MFPDRGHTYTAIALPFSSLFWARGTTSNCKPCPQIPKINCKYTEASSKRRQAKLLIAGSDAEEDPDVDIKHEFGAESHPFVGLYSVS